MSVTKGANCQDAPRLFHIFTRGIYPKNGLVHQTSMTETACFQHHLSPFTNALSSSNVIIIPEHAMVHFKHRKIFPKITQIIFCRENKVAQRI